MINKKNLKYVLLILSFILIIVLLILIFTLLDKFISPKSDIKVTDEVITNKYDTNDIDKINFVFKNASVNIDSTSEENIIITQETIEKDFYMKVKNKSGVLTVQERNKFFNNKKRKYTILIPRSYEGEVYIKNGFGNLYVNDINGKLGIENNAGSLTIFNYYGDDIYIKDVSGNIYLDEINGKSEINTTIGNISIRSINGYTNLDTLTGDINISRFEVTSPSGIENVSGDININISSESKCKLMTSNETGETNISPIKCNDEENILNIKNVTGDININ